MNKAHIALGRVDEVKVTSRNVLITFASERIDNTPKLHPTSVDVIPQPRYNGDKGEEILLHFSGIGHAHVEAERCAANQIRIRVVKDT